MTSMPEPNFKFQPCKRQLLDTEALFDMLKHSNDEHAETKLQVSDLQYAAFGHRSLFRQAKAQQ